MSKLLLLYGYNNYFNRIMKRENSLADYKTKVGEGYYVELDNTNFNVTDGVNARHIFNVSSFLDGKSPDYLIREVTKTVNEQTITTLERWFVLESIKVMGNQIQLSLRRDMIADYYDEIKVAPAFIQKGMLGYDSPLIFNKEGLTFNQIKKKEILLKDRSKAAWIVGYIARGEATTDTTVTGYVDDIPGKYEQYDNLPTIIKDVIEDGSDVTCLFNEKVNFNIFIGEASVILGNLVLGEHGSWFNQTLLGSSNDCVKVGRQKSLHRYYLNTTENDSQIISRLRNATNNSNFREKIAAANNLVDITSNNFNKYNGVIVIKDNQKYKLVFEKSSQPNYNYYFYKTDINTTPLGLEVVSTVTAILNSSSNYGQNIPQTANDQKLAQVQVSPFVYKAKLVPVVRQSVKTNLPNETTVGTETVERNRLNDAPYDIFAIPLSDEVHVVKNQGTQFTTKSDVALSIARAIKEKFGSRIYDIQILPYCPMLEVFPTNYAEGTIEIGDLVEHKDYEFITTDETSNPQKLNIMLFPTKSKTSIDIDLDYRGNFPELKPGKNTIDKKVMSETMIIRFVSPNYNGQFDFNAQKNEGCTLINVDINFKPYTPYIHVAPVFSGLYGDDYNDARGLICGGDFSISTAVDQWQEYQIQNANFQNIFDRQIQNMDVNNSIAMEKAKYTATIGAISAGVQGATGGMIAGATVGGGVGAAVGAVVGGVSSAALSAAAGLKDVELLGRQQSENRDYAVDMYTYQLGNIQALPYSLSKVSAFNENNKLFPFIEIYDCTDIEKQNLRDKIKYNGMTVMVQGKIEDYVHDDGDYIQAKLIRLEGIYEDNHMIVEIYNELMKGIYIYG